MDKASRMEEAKERLDQAWNITKQRCSNAKSQRFKANEDVKNMSFLYVFWLEDLNEQLLHI